MRDSLKYIVTAVVCIAVIVVSAVFIRNGNQRFTQTLEELNNTLTTQGTDATPNLPAQPTAPAPVVTDPPVQQPVQPTAPEFSVPATPAVSDTAPVQQPTDANANASTPPAAVNDAATLTYLNNAVNAMRATQNFTAVKNQTIDIQLTDCSAPAFTGIINGVINGMMGTEEYTYTFTNGVATDPEENKQVSGKTAIPPTDKDFTLMTDGIASISSKTEGTNTVYTIVLKPESSTKDVLPVYHGATMDCFDFAALDLPIEVTSADFNYHGATIDITIDAQGRVVKYHENMPLDGVGGGKMGFLSATATLEGYLDETWTITY